MTRSTDAGMFLLPVNGLVKLPTEMLGHTTLWCKIAEMIIRTSCLPNPTRYIFYKVNFWLSDPTLDDFATDPLPLVTNTNVSDFVVPVRDVAYTAEQYEQHCISDFLLNSFKRATKELDKQTRVMKDAWDSVRFDYNGGKGIRFFTRDSSDIAAEYRSIWHETTYQQVDHVLALASERAIGNTLNGNINIVNVSYFAEGTTWYSYFKNEVLSPRIYERQAFFQLPK